MRLQQLFPLLQRLCFVVILGFDCGALLLGDSGELLLDLLHCLGELGPGVRLRGGIRGVLRLRLLRFLGFLDLLELVPVPRKLVQLLHHLSFRVRWSFVKWQLRLRLMLLVPPLLKLFLLLRHLLHLGGIDPCHVLLDEDFGLFHVLDVLLYCVWQVSAELQLHGPLVHGGQQGLQVAQPGRVVGRGRPGLVHPILVLGEQLCQLLALLFSGHLDDVLTLELLPAAVDGSLELVLHPGDCQDLLFRTLHLLHRCSHLLDLLITQRFGQVVGPCQRELLVVLLFLQFLYDLNLLFGRGSVGLVGRVILRRLLRGILLVSCRRIFFRCLLL
mmetsp:Transcript_49840/g.139027  ORF Transcript_49840/g.139027 Transcript_49840/m.139027 type:complete len:329 (+) Transcript_49840:579-1565(+)